MSDLDINKKRLELINLTFDELVERCIQLMCEFDCMETALRQETEYAYQAGGAKGYTEGLNDGRDERRY